MAQPVSKRRTSSTSSKVIKSIKWPHKFLSAEDLAKAGFFYYPKQSNPDNVTCFLCHRSLDGWEKDDDPLVEHLKHSPGCGWAITATIEMQDGDLSEDDPFSTRMLEARKATFANKWPHEDKKGWKCRVRQMIDGGWKYAPTSESDDMASCPHCCLALDGWEKGDKPLDEHYKRSPDCSFFSLLNNHKQSTSKRIKTKRASKTSRLSVQSTFTITSVSPSIANFPAEDGDSILTTTTTASKKVGKSKKQVMAKTRKTKTKKEEPVGVVEYVPADLTAKIPEQARGRKRKSEEVLQPVEIDDMHPMSKRRALRTRGSTAIDESIISHIDEPPQPLPKTRGKKSKPSRRASVVSVTPITTSVFDEDAIDKALETDLNRPFRENEPHELCKAINFDHVMFSIEPAAIDEAEIELELDAMEVDSMPLPKAKTGKCAKPREVPAQQRGNATRAAKAEAEADQIAEEEAAAQQLLDELEHSISIQNSSPIDGAKRSRTSSRHATGPLLAIATKGPVMPSKIGDVSTASADTDDGENTHSGNETDASEAIQETINRGRSTVRESTSRKGRATKKSFSKKIEKTTHQSQEVEFSTQVKEPISSIEGKSIFDFEGNGRSEEPSVTTVRAGPACVVQEVVTQDEVSKPLKAKTAKPRGRPPRKASKGSKCVEQDVPVIEKEPTHVRESAHLEVSTFTQRSPTPLPCEMAPSQSPQSSNAENQPPSRPSAITKKVDTPLTNCATPVADTAKTMMSLTPSRRNMIANLQTDQPWTAADLEAIFTKSPSGSRMMGDATDIFGIVVDRIQNGDLTSPEKKMTVEEWILYNAELAEQRLREECERMVNIFEREGTRAMRALEGIECLE